MAMQKNHYSMLVDGLFRIGVQRCRDFLHENGRVSQRFTENVLYDTHTWRQVESRVNQTANNSVPRLKNY
jgi:hypothetical protein